MSKEEEELLIAAVVLIFGFKLISQSSQTTLGLAKISSSTDVGYANAAANLASNLADDFVSD